MKKIIILFCLLISSCSFAQKTFEENVDRLVEEAVERNRYSGSILVMQDDHQIMAKGYGLANPEHNILNRPDTAFRIGSMTKQFTAMGVMILKERGELRLSDTVGNYFPDFELTKDITVHQLLTHSSGLVNYTSLPFYQEIMRLQHTSKALIDRLHTYPLHFEPGTSTGYSNSNYLLLTAIIEKVAGVTFEEFLEVEIFKKLGMKTTGLDSHRKLIPNRALGLSVSEQGVVPADFIDVSVANGAGAMYSTLNDLAIWYRAIRDNRLIGPETTELMLTPFKNGFAAGWFVGQGDMGKKVSHGGAINGFESHIAFYPDSDSLIVVLSNVEESVTSTLAKKLEEGLFKGLFEPFEFFDEIPLNIEEAKRIVGLYELNSDLKLEITFEEEQLYAQATGQPKVEVFQAGANLYFLKVVDAKLSFIFDERNNVTQLLLEQNGRPTLWVRKED